MNRLALILAGVAINANADPKPPTHDWIKDPYWADPSKKTVTLGRHTFYKLK